MNQKGMTFQEACEWIAEEIFDMEIPEASEGEKRLMRVAAKEFIQEMKDSE